MIETIMEHKILSLTMVVFIVSMVMSFLQIGNWLDDEDLED